jgi:S-adenosylmethionine uptake transporter
MTYMLVASGSFAAMNACAAQLARSGIPWQTGAFARAALGVALAIIIARARGARLTVRRRGAMWSRSLAGSGAMLGSFYALGHLPLADATALLNTAPLWTIPLAYVGLRELPGPRVLIALFVAAAGLVLVLRPSAHVSDMAGLVALGAGASAAFALVSLRRLAGETPEGVVVHFFTTAMVVTGALLGAEIVRQGGHPPLHLLDVVCLLGIGISGTVAQLAVTRAYALDRAVRVGVVGWVQIALELVIDAALFRGALPAITVTGIALMLSAGGLLVFDAYDDGRKMGAVPQPVRASKEGQQS